MTERKRKGGDGRRLGARRERFLFATAEPGFAGACR